MGAGVQEGGNMGGVGTADGVCHVLIDSYESDILSELLILHEKLPKKCSY